ncbi:MAG: outer rane biosis protein BamB [Pedosphaera sp.]|nr:outer rane biosis protein BamB [Pedosphaera sp.]
MPLIYEWQGGPPPVIILPMHRTWRATPGLICFSLLSLCVNPLRADDWPQWLGPQRDSVWRETGIVQKFPEGGPSVRWRTPIGAGYAGPAVAQGRVYVIDRQLAKDANNPADPFDRGIIHGTESVVCLEEATGKILWKHEYDAPYSVSYPAGPRTTPLVKDSKVYTLGAEGELLCLESKSGNVIWSHELKKEYNIPAPLWGFAASPLLDGNRLICLIGGTNAAVVAFNKDTGVETWRALTAKDPGYCPPIIISAGGKSQLIVWHPQSVNSLNPETGDVYWTKATNINAGMTIATPRQQKDSLFFTTFYNGSMMFHLDPDKPAATVTWQSKKVSEKDTDALHCTMSTPFFEDGYIYGVCNYGQLRCLKADTGERVWETLEATTNDGKELRWANAFIVKNGDHFFLFNEKGDIIIARLSPKGYEPISRAHLLEPTNTSAGRNVLWSHPAFANRCMYARNDKEIICVNLAQ